MGTNKFVIGLAVFFMGLFLVTLQGAANASIAKTADASQATVQPDLITLTTTCSTALSGGYGSVSYNCGPYSGSLEVAPYLQTVIPSEDMTVGWAVQSWSWGLLNCEWVGSVNNIAPGNYGVSESGQTGYSPYGWCGSTAPYSAYGDSAGGPVGFIGVDYVLYN
jgi:hypothetical protein